MGEVCDYLDCQFEAAVEIVYHGDPPMTDPVRRLALCSPHDAEIGWELASNPGWERHHLIES